MAEIEMEESGELRIPLSGKSFFNVLILIAASFCLLIIACDCVSASEPITVVDFRGKTLTLKKPVERIVCLIESALSGIYMLGEERRVVGISWNVYSEPSFKYYAAMDKRIRNKKMPAPGNWDSVSIENIVALRPDVVIIWSEQKEVIEALEKLGIKVFAVFIKNVLDIEREMLALGRLTGSEKKAKKLVAYAKDEVRRFTSALLNVSDFQKPRVYFMWAQGNFETSCAGSAVNDIISLGGGRNVCSHLPYEHITVNIEQIMIWNPDLIIMWSNDRKDPSDIIADSQWRQVKAIRSGKVYELPEAFLSDLWTLKYIYAVKMVAKWAHPELFKDVDLETEKRRTLDMLYGGRLKTVKL